MNTIEEKLKQFRGLEITSDEWNIISQNVELKTLFLNLVKEGLVFNVEDLNSELMLVLMTKEYLYYLLDMVKKSNPALLVGFFSYDLESDKVIEEFSNEYGPEVYKMMVDYYNKNKKEILKLFLEHIDELYGVSNTDFINLIIEHGLIKHLSDINVEILSPKLENFIINNINEINDKLNVVSDRIIEACINKGKAILLIRFFEEDKRIEDAIIKDFEDGKVDYSELTDSFIKKHLDSIKIVKAIISSDFGLNYYDLDLNVIRNSPELIDYIVDGIRNNTLKVYSFQLRNLLDVPKIMAVNIEYLMAGYDLRDILNDENFIKFYEYDSDWASEVLRRGLVRCEDEMVSFIRALINRNEHEKYRDLIYVLLRSLTFKDYLRLLDNHYLRDETIEFFKKFERDLEFSITELPENFDTKVNYHSEKVLLKIIPLLSFEQLDPDVLGDSYYSTPALKEAVIIRLAELRSNKFNSRGYLFSGDLTPRMTSIILSEDNPLNLTPTQILSFIPNDIGKIKFKYLKQIIDKSDVLTAKDVNAILAFLVSNYRYGEEQEEFDPEKFDILTTLLRCNKIDINQELYRYIGVYLNGARRFVQEKEIKALFREFLLTRDDVPLSLSIVFDQEVRSKSTYKYEYLVSNPGIFDSNYNNVPEDYFAFLNRAMEKHHKIDFLLIYNAVKANNAQRLDLFNSDKLLYDFIEYNGERAITAVREIASNNAPGEVYIKAVARWMEQAPINHLRGQSFILKYVYKHEELLKILIDRTKNEDFKFDYEIFNILFTTYSKEFFNEAKMFLFKQLRNKNVDIVNISITSELLKLKYPEVDEFLASEYFTRFGNISWINSEMFETIKKKKVLYDALISRLKEEPSIIVNSIYTIQFPEFKKILVDAIKNNKVSISAWNLNVYYFDVDIVKVLLERDSSYIKNFVNILIHNEQIARDLNPSIGEEFLPYIVKEYDINKDSLLSLMSLYGYNTYRLLENKDVIDLLNKDPETVSKLVELLKVRELDITTITAINDSIEQQIYAVNHPEEITLFTTILAKIQHGITEEEVETFINILCKKVNGEYIYLPKELRQEDNAFKYLCKNGNEEFLKLNELYKQNKEEFLRVLFKKIKTNQNIYAPILNIMTTSFLGERRNEVTRNEDIYRDTNIKFTYNTKQLYDAMFKYFVKENPQLLINELSYLCKIGAISDSEFKLDKLTILFLNDSSKLNLSKEQIGNIKRNIPSVKARLLDLLSMFNPEEIDSSYLVGVSRNVTFDTRVPDINDIANINFNVIYDLLGDKDKYECLLKLINKYKILEWSNLFDTQISRLSLGETTPDLYNFINAFSFIYDNEMKLLKRARREIIESTIADMREQGKSESDIDRYIKFKENEPYVVDIRAFKVVKYATIYSALANGYKIILGLEDFELTKRNDPPFSANKGSLKDRLDFNTGLMLRMMEMDEVTIPSFVKSYDIEGKKPLQVIVGCKSDSRNLTMGERTGACMRAYGYADTLFEFTNTDPRGFHITFVDPDDGKFISRVSGFRNGNTVFLNQLRHSLDAGRYTDDDVIAVCRLMARDLIERSKDSEMPIENVVISPSYALEFAETERLSVDDIGRGVYDGYKDVNSNAHILATVSEDGKPVDVKLSSKQPMYKCCRLPIRVYESPNITDTVKILIQRVDAIKECLSRKDVPYYYMSIDYDFDILEQEYVYVIIGQDFYVALDIDGNIIKNIAVDREDALEEYASAIEKVEAYKQSLSSGGKSNGLL